MNFIKAEKLQISTVLLTHGHYDHVWDCALLQNAFHCPIYGHPLDFVMIRSPGYLKNFGIADTYPVPKKLEPLQVPEKGSMPWSIHGHDFTLYHVPGHCPGSIAFYLPARQCVFGGDVLFAGGVGRWDLPGGSRADLIESLRTKFLTLPDETVVYPGHGSITTIAQEKRTNPYLK
jgi:glyoxylase-like metal-dependent hydrolase (beta-lactamase superfamily II)